MYSLGENEHQELFHCGIDLTQPVALHIPSPLGPLGYYVFVRVAAGMAQHLGGVSVRFDLIGLRESHVTLASGQDACTPAVIPSKFPGSVWFCVGRAKLARGDGPMTFSGWPVGIKKADLLLCTWPRFVTSGDADRWIEAQSDPLWAPSGVPLGGIGGGRVDLCRDGRFRNFSMNNNQDAPMEDVDGIPGAYLAVESQGVIIDLAARPIVVGHQSCKKLEYQPRFPQATLRAPDVYPGLEAVVTLSGTTCPHDLRRASIPGFLVRWELRNTGRAPQTVTCRMGWPNLVGLGGGIARAESRIGYGDGYYQYWCDPAGRQEAAFERAGITGVKYSGQPAPEHLASSGEHWLAAAGKAAVTAGSGQGEVCIELEVAPGKTVVATMALVAAMPHWVDSLGVDRGRAWQVHFKDGEEMIQVLLAESDSILSEAGALGRLFDDSSLPDWLIRRLSNCNYPLVTNSVWYRDGRFSINEGPTEMAGCYGTIDQRLGAHSACQLLFPSLNAQELGEFAAIQGPEGGILHDLGGGNLERPAGDFAWPDLTCSFIIQAARHAWSTGDRTFEESMWPHARRALLRHARWADEGRGVAQVGKGLGTSYDSYHYIGTTGYIATLWLAALAVMETWAGRRADAELLQKIPGWRTAALERLDADLWNGQYYVAYGEAGGARRDTCHAGQLAGQWFSRMLTGRDVADPERIQACASALVRLNGSRRFAIPPDEVSPDGSEGAPFGWLPYVEAFMLTAVATVNAAGVWPTWKRMVRVMGDDAHPCDTRLMYRPLHGEPSWGAYYMTAPASWLVYDAVLDFFYSAVGGVLRLGTAVPGSFPIVHPRFWGMAKVAADGQVTLTVQRVFGNEPIAVSILELPTDVKTVEIEGRAVKAAGGQGVYRHYPLGQSRALKAGDSLNWRVRRTAG